MKQPKILVIRLSSIGDILLTSPFLRQIRSSYPEAQIDFVVKKEFSELIEFNPHIDAIFSIDTTKKRGELKGLRRQIVQKKYDYIFDLHNNFRSNYLTAGLTKSKISKDKLKRALLVYTGINHYREIIPIALRYLNVGAAAHIEDDGKGLELYWTDHLEKKVNQTFAREDWKSDFIAIAPWAAHFSKRWPLERFRQLAEKILEATNLSIVLLGSKAEASGFQSLVISDEVLNLAGKLSLLESAVVLNRAKVLVSNDSGLMHMATALQTPLVAIFGSTVRELGFFPFRSPHIVLENKELKCRPCSHIGRKDCPKKHFKCMLELESEQVFNAVQQTLGF